MRFEWALALIYLAFIPIATFLVAMVIIALGLHIAAYALGFSLMISSFMLSRFLPKEEGLADALAVASLSFWLFTFLSSFMRSGFDPLLFALFVLSSWVLYVVSIEKDLST